VIADKRATIVPAPGLRRPPVALPLPSLYLASDAAASDYPSTLEGSVRSGIAAARALVAEIPPG
jgi:monoamine oxidase